MKRNALIALIALGQAPLVLGLNNELQGPDPEQYAEVARRIARSGDWLHFRDNFGPFLNKPPVTLWLMASSIELFGPTSFAARLPHFFAGLLLLFAVYRIGRLLFDETSGLVASALLSSSVAFHLMVTDPKVDMVVTCTMALTVWMLLESRANKGALWLAWAFAGLGILSKGPIGLCAPLAAVFPEALRHQWGASERGTLVGRMLAFKPLRGLLLVALLLAPWYWAVFEEHGIGGPKFLLLEQSFGRLFHVSEYKDDTTPLFFVHTGLWAFLPFTPVLLFEIARSALAVIRARALPHDERRIVWWWLAIPFAALSLAEFKLPQYLFWLAPPGALIAGRALTQASEPVLRVLGRIHVGLMALSAAGAAFVLWRVFPGPIAVWLAAFVAVGVAALAVSRRVRPVLGAAVLMVASVSAPHVLLQVHLHPSLTAYRPEQEWGTLVRREDPSGAPLPFVHQYANNAAAYYADRDAIEMDAAALVERVRRGETKLAVTHPTQLASLESLGLRVEPLLELPLYTNTSKPDHRFLDARTRNEVVDRQVLVRVTPAERAAAP